MLKQLTVDEQLRQESYYIEKILYEKASTLGHTIREGTTNR